MKVAIVTSFPRDLDRPHGGVEAVSVNLVRALAENSELEVHVVTTDRSLRSTEVSMFPSESRASVLGLPSSATALCSFTVHRLPAPQSSLLGYAVGQGRRQMQDYLRQLKPELVHAHDFYGLMTQGLPIPRVFTIHGFIHEDTRYAGGLCAWFRSWLWKHFEIRCWREQPHIISISPYVRERLRGISRGAIHDIENPIDEACFNGSRNEQPGTVFCAAAICRRKNAMGLVRAIDLLRQQGVAAQLRWAGTVTEAHYRETVQGYVGARGLDKNIVFLGALPAEGIRAELRKASVFALLSYEEGAPMGIAEAMAAGAPVVSSNRCGMPYMVRDGESGFLVEPDRPAEVAERLRRLLVRDDLRHRMGVSARAFALQRFHPDVVVQRTVGVYERACAEAGRANRSVAG